MGVTSDEEGEPSQQTSNSEDRPMKKARYIWQVKGKYHLKQRGTEEFQEPNMSLSQSEAENDEYSFRLADVKDVDNLGERLQPTSIPILGISVPRRDNPLISSRVPTPTEDASSPITHSVSNSVLAMWQRQNMGMSLSENTFNSLLEAIGFIALPGDIEVRIPGYGDNNNLEDEAVLMAIQSHGLQNPNSEGEDSQGNPCCTENQSLSTLCLCKEQTSCAMDTQILNPFHKRPVACVATEVEHQLVNNFLDDSSVSDNLCVAKCGRACKYECSDTSALLDPELKASIGKVQNCDNLVKIVNTVEQCAPTQDKSVSSTTQIKFESVELPECKKCAELADESTTTQYDHFDFLDQAVAVAIQKKGLSTLSCSEFG